MRRTARDNPYLHRDFHGALSIALDYLAENFGKQVVIDYIRSFTQSYYSPVRQRIAEQGLPAVADHIRTIYENERAPVELQQTEDELLVRVESCPAVMHMRKSGYSVSDYFIETTRTVNLALVEGSAIETELLEYDPQTGRSVQRFWRAR